MLLAAIALFTLAFLALWAGIYRVLPSAWRTFQAAWAALARAILSRQRFARWYERGSVHLQPLHPYRPLLYILAIGFLVSAMTGSAFLFLAEAMRDNNALLARVDETVWRSSQQFRRPGATLFFAAFSYLGTGIGLGILVLIVAGVLLARGHRRWATFHVVTAAGGGLLNHALKAVFARARPDMAEALWRSTSYSFPSGHAMGSLVVFGALVYLVMRGSHSWRLRSAAAALGLCVVGAISLSRIYLGVHWFSDIVAGVSAGLVWLATTTAAYEVFRRMRPRVARTPAGEVPEEARTPGRQEGAVRRG
jgi:undecaprenyl-diphosphatase